MDKSRLETFADAVFGFAATLLVTRIVVQANGGELGARLVHAWPEYAAYGLSFLMISIWWVNHHEFMSFVGAVDRRFLFANVAFLACIAFLPFPTGLVAAHFDDAGLEAAAVAYTLTLTAAAVAMAALWLYASGGRRLLAPSADPATVRRITWYNVTGVPGCGAATLLALASPQASLALIAAIALFYVIGVSPFSPARAAAP